MRRNERRERRKNYKNRRRKGIEKDKNILSKG